MTNNNTGRPPVLGAPGQVVPTAAQALAADRAAGINAAGLVLVGGAL